MLPGDRVVCLPIDACGLCKNCGINKTKECNNGIALGHNAQGGLAEFVKVREFSAVKIPANIGWDQAAILACPIGVGLEELSMEKRTETKQTAMVTGAGGGLGIHLVQLAKLKGYKVLAITSHARKLSIIQEMGADQVTVKEDIVDINLTIPVCAPIGQRIALSRRVDGIWHLIGYGIIQE